MSRNVNVAQTLKISDISGASVGVTPVVLDVNSELPVKGSVVCERPFKVGEL